MNDAMDIAFSLIGFALTLVMVWLFLYLYNSKFEARFSKGISAICMCGAVFFILFLTVALDKLHASTVVSVLVLGAVLLVYLFLCRKGTAAQKLFWFFISAVFFAVSQTITSVFSAAMYGPRTNYLQLNTSQMLTLTLVGAAIQGVSFILLGQKKRRDVSGSPLQVFILTLIPGLLCFILTVWTDYNTQYPNADGALSMLHFTASAAIAAIAFLVFILYENMLTAFEHNMEQRAIAQKASMIERHNEELMMLYKETGSVRHDMSNHVLTMKALLAGHDYEALEEYLAALSQTVSSTQLPVNTGSRLLDAIVGTKVSLARSAGIKTDMQFNLGGTDIPMAPVDLTSLVSNLLDNAVEACHRIPPGEEAPFIQFKMLRTDGQLLIAVRNAMDGVVRVSGGRYLTRKKGSGHGIGIRQIDSIVERYNGVVERQHSGHVFETLIRIRLPEEP